MPAEPFDDSTIADYYYDGKTCSSCDGEDNGYSCPHCERCSKCCTQKECPECGRCINVCEVSCGYLTRG